MREEIFSELVMLCFLIWGDVRSGIIDGINVRVRIKMCIRDSHYNRYDTLPEVFAQIEKITAGQILEVANEVLAPERLFCLIYE